MLHAACCMLNTSQHATCDMRHATCDMQHATCNMRHATRNMRHATCVTRHATCGVRPAVLCVVHAQRGARGGRRRARVLPSVLRRHFAPAGMSHVACCMLHVANSMLHVVCCVLNAAHVFCYYLFFDVASHQQATCNMRHATCNMCTFPPSVLRPAR